jgi:hypothetical protein
MSTFTDWLAEFGHGALDDELAAALSEVSEQVQLQGKKGTITLKLTVSQHKAGALVVDADVDAKPPKGPGRSAIFFFDPESGELSRRDPRQPQIPGVEDRNRQEAPTHE